MSQRSTTVRKLIDALRCSSDFSSGCSLVDIDDSNVVFADWRKDPKRSLSDYTIIVSHDGNHSKTYHVHKANLTTGLRRSEYFVNLLTANTLRREGIAAQVESFVPSTNTDALTEINLPRRPAETFPLLLDYIYSDSLNELSHTNAPALRFLANYFDIRELYKIVSSFIRSDMGILTAPTYCIESHHVKDREVLNMSLRICAENISNISQDMLGKFPPALFNQLISCPHSTCTSEILSEKVAQYLQFIQKQYHRGDSASGKEVISIHDEMFYFLTHSQVLPRISPSVAIFLLSYASIRHPGILKDESLGGDGSSLQCRCVAACSRNWKSAIADPIAAFKEEGNYGGIESNRLSSVPKIGQNIDDENDNSYNQLPDELKVTLLESALIAAKMDTERQKL